MCMTARLDVTPKTTERNQIVRTSKLVTKVTNNNKLRSRYCTIEATKHTDKPEALRGFFAIAELLVIVLSLLQTEINYDKVYHKIYHHTSNPLLHYLVK